MTAKEHIALSVKPAMSPSVTVKNLPDSWHIVKELQDLFSDVELLLTYGPTNDEQALVRDAHRAVSHKSDQGAKDLLQMPVYNLFEACLRLKQAHDRKYSPAIADGQNAEEMKRRYGLDAMHRHFVLSTGERFVTPLPEGMLRRAFCYSENYADLMPW